jgi:hypothetical protein
MMFPSSRIIAVSARTAHTFPRREQFSGLDCGALCVACAALRFNFDNEIRTAAEWQLADHDSNRRISRFAAATTDDSCEHVIANAAADSSPQSALQIEQVIRRALRRTRACQCEARPNNPRFSR